MKTRLVALLPVAILALAVLLRIADPPAIEHLRLKAFDGYQQLRPRPWTDAGVVIVDIDDASLARLGQWPWPRTQVAALVDRLDKLGAAAVAFDVLFAEPDRTAPARVLPGWAAATGDPQIASLAERLPDPDATLARSLQAMPSVIGMMLTDGSAPQRPAVKWGLAAAGDDPRPFLPGFSGAVVPLQGLEAAASGIGSLNSVVDRDGMIRRVALVMRLTGGTTATDEIYPSLAAEALRVAQGASTFILKASGASGITSFGAHTGLSDVKIGQFAVPTDPAGRLWLYDTGYVPQRFVPAWQLLAPDMDPARIDGKIVFVGTSAAGLKDIRATPLNPAAAGVELHAQVAEQMILGVFLERPDWMTGAEVVWLIVFGLALILLLPRWGAAWCATIAAAGIAATLTASGLAFVRLGWLVDPVYPSLVVILLYLTQSFLLFLRTEAERRQVRGAFSRYMSPAVVERVARDPGLLRLGGEIRDMTLLFSDIRGFTSISETMDAHTLTRFMNRFLTPMTNVILRHDGTIDKYMGDAIMAFWNAPIDDPDHAVHAAEAALEMVASLEDLNEAWRDEARLEGRMHPAIAIGVGLNTGSCCVGNFGSDQRIDYSVLGDTVNLASRLEGQSKTYGVPIVIGEATRAGLPGFSCLELDLIQVKGKEQAIRIFALVGNADVAAEPWFRAAEATQRALLAAYRNRDWEAAAAQVAELREAADGRFIALADLYQERIDDFRADPPPPGWDGVYRALTK